MERNKKIYFCVDKISYRRLEDEYTKPEYDKMQNRIDFPKSYFDTENCIKHSSDIIVTLSMAHFSFDLMNLGYRIYLCYRDKEVEIKPHMDLTGIGEPCKDLRFGHNIFRIFRAGIFNDLLGID